MKLYTYQIHYKNMNITLQLTAMSLELAESMLEAVSPDYGHLAYFVKSEIV